MTTKDPVTGSRPFGRFSVSQQFVRMGGTLLAETVFNGMVVVRAEANFATDSIDYVGLHPAFEDVPVGQMPPEYVCEVVTSAEGGPPWVSWRKVTAHEANADDALGRMLMEKLDQLQAQKEGA